MNNKSSNNNKYNGRRNAATTRISQIGGVSDRQRVNLKYTTIIAPTNITTTGALSYVFRGNSVFDPDFSGTGGQPVNFDDYAALYNQYRVWQSSIKVHMMTTLSGTEPIMWVLGPRHTSTAVTSATQMDYAAQPYAHSTLQNIYRTGASDTVWSGSMSTRKIQGLSAAEFEGRDDLTSLVSTNPTEVWFWHVTATNVDPSVTSTVCFMAELVYDVEFFDRVDSALDFKQRELRMRGIIGHLENRTGRSSGIARAQLLAPESKVGLLPQPALPSGSTLKKTEASGDEDGETGDGVVVVVRRDPPLKSRRLH